MYREQKAQGKSFGLSCDYYRVRLLKVFEERPVDLEWRDDVLYRSPKKYPSKRKVTYRLQVLNRNNRVHEVAWLQDKREAKKRLSQMEEDLQELTKMKFDNKYGIVETSADTDLVPLVEEKTMYFTGIENRHKD